MQVDNRFKKIDGFKKLYINEESAINYSDGSVENYILDKLKNLKDESDFSILENDIKDWPTEYHFSWVRTNILAPVEFKMSDRVLELGGGTGALSYYIAPKVNKLISIEGSLNRAKCIATRCARFENVETIVSNFQNIDFIRLYGKQSFDKILLIGVLEYVNKYYNSEHGINELLEICHELIKPEGEIIIAIENRLGLKYLLGWEEDHLGKPYIGVENLYELNGVKTFSFKELKLLLKKRGFNSQEFYFPFPDYKLPEVIIKEREVYNKEDHNLITNLLSKGKFRNYSNMPPPEISENLALISIIENDLLNEMSNSFLVITSPNKKIEEQSKPFAYYFSSNRRFDFANKIIFFNDQKKLVFNKYRIKDPPFSKALETDFIKIQNYDSKANEVTSGRLLGKVMEGIFLQKDYKSFEVLIFKYVEFLKSEIKNYHRSEFDLMPNNIIISPDDSFHIIDGKEWETIISFTIEQVIVRFFILNNSFSRYFSESRTQSRLIYYNIILDKFNLPNLDEKALHEIDELHNFSNNNIIVKNYLFTSKLFITPVRGYKNYLKKLFIKIVKILQ